MQNDSQEFEEKPSSNKDMWLFLIVLDVIFLCVFGFFLYKHFSGQLFSPAVTETAVPTQEVQTGEDYLPVISEEETVSVTDAVTAPKTSSGKETDQTAAMSKYIEGLDAYNEGNWQAAQKAFEEIIKLYPTSPSAADAQLGLDKLKALTDASQKEALSKLMEGQEAYRKKDLQKAQKIFEEVVRLYPNSPAAVDAQTFLYELKALASMGETSLNSAQESAEKLVAQTAAKQSITITPTTGKYRRVTFRWFGEGNNVAVVSGFTMSKPQALKKVGDHWETTLSIAPGTYKFLYIIDGKNTLDPYAPEKDGRSVLEVK